MLEDQIAYLNAARDRDTLFYTNKLKIKTHPFVLKEKPNSLWINKSTGYWHYVIYQPDKLPVQGWKIHISAIITQAQAVLDAVTPWLIKKKISFKFVVNIGQLIYSNSKYANRSESGKFITIYPRNDEEFEYLLVQMKKLTQNFDLGPYILSDQNWQESNVYFRYGGFKPIYIISSDGKRLPAIYNPKGQKCVDKRMPYYQKPDFVKNQPIFEQNTFPNPKVFLPLSDYKVESALHFSNAGGVYLALKNNIKVVLKEGRQQAGLDANQRDGFTRVENEAKILKKLSDVSAVVNYYTDFTSWRHHFLVEEYIEGQSLEELLPTEFPFVLGDSKKRNRYKAKIKDILCQLKRVVAEVHSRGIAIGDLSLSNVLVTADNKVRLIDLENAGLVYQKYNPGLTTTGFVSTGVKTFKEADDFAVMRIAYYLFLPIIPVADLAPGIIHEHRRWIGNYFGKDIVKFLNEFDIEINTQKPIFLKEFMTVPKKELSDHTVDYFKFGLTKGIFKHLNFNGLNLVPGLIDKNDDPSVSLLNLSSGAAGVLWAMGNKGDYSSKISNWIISNKNKIISVAKETQTVGLFDGLSGLANVLKNLNYIDLSDYLIDLISKKVDLTIGNNSLATGLSGIALTLRNKYPDLTNKIIDVLLKRWDKVDFSNFEKEDIGLLTGWGGVSYLLWSVGKRKKAKEMLISILQKRSEGKNNLAITDNSRGFERLIPYLEDGTFGLTLLMHKFMREDEAFKHQYQPLFDKLKNSCFTYCTYMETLISGYSGVLPLASAIAKDGDDTMLNYSLDAMNQYLIANGDEIMVPGKYGYKLSINFSYGSAGLLTLLKCVDQSDEFCWLPL
ncbi:MAG: class III lanthionine synthetase LanKC [Lactobacillus crispatus]|jgi:serine/threonine protein kinase|uniref:class III lanthionine synthetase LanKC n=1 Tax=Lactobacillus crispatus TaxID=47770 RepID=UPI0018AA562E|nr:class III lanthionine synthetase LanKC [Lactobacillus crispatus]MCH4003681.1 class III lanthionine synthetase LanKC [Lactobacillus crispatus]MCI1336030.1 class III lanthionine synthetase LanKC [Lactobacillus crispatus]MCI1365450.1 class III lanthionine synthetase LanKC [Lactobacillus crispatus]MCI1494004.1 class III lanthionine synthetase LanKC [Lactobacillus crispatus]MCI1524048.1 class III lanthionine synthetase LanKC [Lactobacillus crispatus]